MKILKSTWTSCSSGTIGILVTENDVGYRKARVGIVKGYDESADEKMVAEQGGPLLLSELKELVAALEVGK